MGTSAPPPALRQAARDLRAWLVDKAYPLWWRAGADLERGGYHDRLNRSGRPAAFPKRARVAARQAWCFAQAPHFAWDGPWRRAMVHGLDFLEAAHLRTDGFYRAFAAGVPGPADYRAELYDQAFVLLALASAQRHHEPTAQSRSRALIEKLKRHPLGGFCELEGDRLLSNPTMHLFEAFMALGEADGGSLGQGLAHDLARLAEERLIDPESGAIVESYDGGWRAPAELGVRAVWPGHQFEWAWLLLRHRALTGNATPPAAALRLIELAERFGVDPKRGVAIDALDGRLMAIDGNARLWPQTERLKANLAAAELTGEGRYWSAALQAAEALWRYLDESGWWRDQLDIDDRFVEEPAPASSLYHIVGAILELERVTGAQLE